MPSRAYHRGRAQSAVAVSRLSFSLLAGLFLVLATSLAVGVAHQLHQTSLSAARSTVTPKYLVVLVLDGAKPEYIHAGSLPHLDALRSQGVEYDRAWAGFLESETPSGHATLATGSSPARTGLLGFNWITDANDQVQLFDPNVVRGGAMERVMEQSGVPTIASLYKERYPRGKVVAVSGHKYYAVDPLGGPKADYIMYYAPDANNHYVPTAIPGHVPPASVMSGPGLSTKTTTLPPGVENRLAVHLAMNSFNKVHQQVTLINLPEFDWPLGHIYGAEAGRAQKLMQDFDKDLGYIEDTYRKAGVLDQTVFVITADHGMGALKYLVPDEVLDNAVTKAGATSLETTYATAGFIWLQDPLLSQNVANNIVQARDTHVQSVYYKVKTQSGDGYVRAGGLSITPEADAANLYLLKSFIGGNAPDVVAFCTEDAGFLKKGAETWKGNHGGAAWQSQHMPLVISGAGVTSNLLSHAPARIEDIAPTSLTLLGVKPTGMEGSVLADGLLNPSKQETKAQQALNRVVTPVVDGLEAQSQKEIDSEASQ